MKFENITAVILSAGLSSRMKKFKPLLEVGNGQTFICYIVNKLGVLCNNVTVVSGHECKALEAHLKQNSDVRNYRVVYNRHYKLGMFSSLQTGLQESDSEWYLYHFVDQPSLPVEFYKLIFNQIHNDYNWIQPVSRRRKGHPILFDTVVKEIIMDSDLESNLRNVNKDSRIIKKFIEYDSQLIFQDIDTPEEYKNAEFK